MSTANKVAEYFKIDKPQKFCRKINKKKNFLSTLLLLNYAVKLFHMFNKILFKEFIIFVVYTCK